MERGRGGEAALVEAAGVVAVVLEETVGGADRPTSIRAALSAPITALPGSAVLRASRAPWSASTSIETSELKDQNALFKETTAQVNKKVDKHLLNALSQLRDVPTKVTALLGAGVTQQGR